MSTVGWLHLTDLHFGFGGQEWLWPTLRAEFYVDLERILKKTGAWDFVFFTGDLTQTGALSEFDALSKMLEELWEHFARLGSSPRLVAIPGNHDLVRPHR